MTFHGELNRWQGLENSLRPPEALLGPEALKHLGDDDRGDGKIVFVKAAARAREAGRGLWGRVGCAAP